MNIFVKSLILLLSSSENFLKISASTISQIYGEEFLEHWNIYVTGPYGTTSQKDGEFFTDFKQSLNGRSVMCSSTNHCNEKKKKIKIILI